MLLFSNLYTKIFLMIACVCVCCTLLALLHCLVFTSCQTFLLFCCILILHFVRFFMWSRLPLAENEEKLLKWPRAQTVKKTFAFLCVCVVISLKSWTRRCRVMLEMGNAYARGYGHLGVIITGQLAKRIYNPF